MSIVGAHSCKIISTLECSCSLSALDVSVLSSMLSYSDL